MIHFNILAKLLLVTAVGLYFPVPTIESIVREVFSKFNFGKESGLLLFWACTHSDSEDGGYIVTLTDQYRMSTPDEGLLQNYRNKSIETCYPVVGSDTDVGNWSAGRAAQTQIADHLTKHHVLAQEDQHSANLGGMGQLVVPVFDVQDALVGIIEFVTPVPKESYAQDFEQLKNLLEDEGLESTYIGKTIKVGYKNHLIKFALPLSAKFTDLQMNVGKRFPELKQHQNFCAEYTDGNHLPISNDGELQACIAESSSKGAKLVRMHVLLNAE